MEQRVIDQHHEAAVQLGNADRQMNLWEAVDLGWDKQYRSLDDMT